MKCSLGYLFKSPAYNSCFWFNRNNGFLPASVARFSISLTSRPEKNIFSRQERAFCHDGILVEQPERLAELLLKGDNNTASINDLKNSIANYAVTNFVLKKPVPIKITYITCEVRSNVVVYYPDLYNMDIAMEGALYNTNRTCFMY